MAMTDDELAAKLDEAFKQESGASDTTSKGEAGDKTVETKDAASGDTKGSTAQGETKTETKTDGTATDTKQQDQAAGASATEQKPDLMIPKARFDKALRDRDELRRKVAELEGKLAGQGQTQQVSASKQQPDTAEDPIDQLLDQILGTGKGKKDEPANPYEQRLGAIEQALFQVAVKEQGALLDAGIKQAAAKYAHIPADEISLFVNQAIAQDPTLDIAEAAERYAQWHDKIMARGGGNGASANQQQVQTKAPPTTPPRPPTTSAAPGSQAGAPSRPKTFDDAEANINAWFATHGS